MKGTMHWTAGTYKPNNDDRTKYHGGITWNPKTGLPDFEKWHNFTKPLSHTWEDNTANIGIALCGMMGAEPGNFGQYPIQKTMVELLVEVCARISVLKNFNAFQWLTHAERAALANPPYGINSGDPETKWDLSILTPLSGGKKLTPKMANETGKELRKLIGARIEELKKELPQDLLSLELTKAVKS